MDYKIEFYKNVNSVSKSNINKMGLENMFDYYNGNDVSFLRFVATLNNNNWKASKEAENDDYVVYKFFSDIYSNKLYIYFYKNIIDMESYKQTMDIIKTIDVNYKPNDNIINISDYLDKSNDNLERKYKYVKYNKTCNKIINKKKIALYALTGSFIALIGIAAGNLIAEKLKNDNDKSITSNLDNSSSQKVPGVSNQTFYDTIEKAKNDQLEVRDNSDNQQFWYSKENVDFDLGKSQNELMKEKLR